MPQSTAAIRLKADTLRALRDPQFKGTSPTARQGKALVAGLSRPVRARAPHLCAHGTCLSLDLRGDALWVLVRDKAGAEDWAPVARILSFEERRRWAREGFG